MPQRATKHAAPEAESAAAHAKRESLRLIQSEVWPLFSVLPLKRYNTALSATDHPGPEIGTLCARLSTDAPWYIFLASIYEKDIAQAKRLSYPTPEAIVADGWVVD